MRSPGAPPLTLAVTVAAAGVAGADTLGPRGGRREAGTLVAVRH